MDRHGSAIGVLVFAIEVTERKLEGMRKNDFIVVVSHELKTPLTSLTAIVQIATSRLKHKVSEDGVLLGIMDRAGSQLRRMAAIINSFLDVSRLESSQMQLNKSTVNFTQLVIEAMEELQLSSSGHQLVMECRDEHEVVVDKEKLISVVTNLIVNAVKYSPAGGRIEMTCSCTPGKLLFSVSDTALGIAYNDLERIFDRYYRVSSRGVSNISGFGIGLYLTSEIVRLHEGEIWAESELGVGSTFYVSLPCLGSFSLGGVERHL